MKAVILAGGLGTRISEETGVRPKPMVEIGGKPILWHIMKIYSYYGVNEFIVCCGYKGYCIKEYFANYFLHTSDVTFSMEDNKMEVHQRRAEPWKVTLVDTGETTMTGGRIKRVKNYLENDEAFCLTYGDGLSNVNIKELIKFHKESGKLATLTSVSPPGRFGALKLNGNMIEEFIEKPNDEKSRINGGFFVLSPKVIDLIENDKTTWEKEPLEQLAKDKQLCSFEHNDFWMPMDTLRDKNKLEELWESGNAPWKLWN
ncbi:glucose-1-phosphate cytidylyltransferase [Acetoanaerobium sticklandii]|uniref:glucose-1-phosphate cytidylyltransferase n=1 Tax=Acetoanaerobium sticklandii TaxID=1511 RepID=UPI003A8E6DB3